MKLEQVADVLKKTFEAVSLKNCVIIKSSCHGEYIDIDGKFTIASYTTEKDGPLRQCWEILEWNNGWSERTWVGRNPFKGIVELVKLIVEDEIDLAIKEWCRANNDND